MRRERFRNFNFDPGDFLNDPNVLVMSLEERGAYITLLCRAWEMAVPGVLPADEGIIRRLIGATPAEWDRVRAALRRCFDASDGRWVQKRMHQEYEARTRRFEAARKAGRVAGIASGIARAARRSNEQLNDLGTNAQPPSLSLSRKEAEEPTLLVPDGTERRVSDFLTAWSAYPHYGRRSSKAVSRRRWMAQRPHPVLAEVLAGIQACKAEEDWQREGGRFVPAMEVWIGRRGWDSAPVRAVLKSPLAGPMFSEQELREPTHQEKLAARHAVNKLLGGIGGTT